MVGDSVCIEKSFSGIIVADITMRILKDPVWQFVGVVVAIVIGLTTWLIYFINRPVKEIRVDVLSNSPLVSRTQDIPEELQILYKGKSVQTLSLILLRLANTGNEPIREDDYSEPIRVTVSQNAEIGQVTIQETRPEGMPLSPRIISNHQVELAKTLFNPEDQAILKILVLNNDQTLKVTARIVGVRQIALRSVLEQTGGISNKIDVPLQLIFALIIIGVLLILFVLIWQSRSVIKWRMRRFGFDPAFYFYTQAQEAMLKPPSSTRISEVIQWLDRAFSWDASYMERAKTESLFSDIHGYHRFTALIKKYGTKQKKDE